MEELRETTQRLAGTDFGMHHPVWLSRFSNATRVAAAFRHGRILLTAAVLRPDGHVRWATEQRPESAAFAGTVCSALQELPATF